MASYGIGPVVKLQGANEFSLRAGTGEMSFDTDTTTDAVRINNAGNVRARGNFSMDNGTYRYNLTMPAGMTTDLDFTFPNTNPSTGQVLKFSGSVLIWDNESITVDQQFVVRKNPASGEFSSVADACNAAALETRSATTRYVVYVYSGTYTESETIVIPSFVHVVGESLEGCIVQPSGNFNVVEMSNQSSLAFITVLNASVGYYGVTMVNVGDYALCHKVDMDDCDSGIYCEGSSVDSYCFFEYCSCNGCPVVGIEIVSSGGFVCFTTVENHFFEPPCDQAIRISGADATLSANVCVITGDMSTHGVHMNGGEISVRGFYIEDCAVGIHVDAAAVNPKCLLSAVLFDDCTQNLQIDSATTTGQFDGFSAYEKTYINPASAFFITNKDNNIITVAKKGGDFTSVKDAIDSITGASSTNQFSVYVGPGQYDEDPITMKAYVTLSGFSASGTIINANNASGNLVTMVGNSTLQTVTLTGATSGILVKYSGDAGAGTIYVTDMLFRNGQTLMDVDSTVGPALVNMKFDQVRSNAVFTTGFKFTSGTNPISLIMESLSWSPISGGLMPAKFFDITSSSVGPVTNNVFMSSVFIGQRSFAASGIGINIEGACYVSVLGGTFGGFATGLSVPATTVTAPNVTMQSTNFTNCTTDISILNTGTTGALNVGAERAKTTIASGVNISFIARDTASGDFIVSGNLFQGPDFSTIVDITPAIQNAVGVGIISGGTFSFTGTTLTVQSGVGYLLDGGTQLKYVTWTTQNSVLAAGSYYFWIDTNGALQTGTSAPSTLANILIGRAYMDGSGVVYLQRIAKDSVQTTSKHDTTFRVGLGVLFVSGCIASAGTVGLRVSVSSGAYFYATKYITPSSVADISMIGFYDSGNSFNTLTAVPLQYDNAGTLTAIPVGKWVKHMLYVVGDGADQKYIFVYGQELFDLEVDAQNGNLPSSPGFVGSNAAELCGIIVTDSDVGPLGSDRFRDIRNIRGANRVSGATASADHNSLLNLTTGNPHTQYVQKAGDTLSGSLNFGGNNITNCGTYNGITIQSISSRLIPGGADPLATAAPVTIGTANSIGIANSFARSDHVHNHGNLAGGSLHSTATTGADGFMSAGDKTRLDEATELATAKTLVYRDGDGRSNFTIAGITNVFTADIVGSPDQAADYTLTLPKDVGSATQVLTTDGTGILDWSTPLTDVTTTAGDIDYRNSSNVHTRLPVGSTNQVLTVTGVNTLGWATPTTYLTDPMTTAGDMIIRNAGNTTTRLPAGSIGNQLAMQGGVPTWREPIMPTREMVLYDDFNGATSPFGDTLWLLSTSGIVSTTQAFPSTSNNTFGCTRFAFSTATATWGISKNVTTGMYFGTGTSYTEVAVFVETLGTVGDPYALRVGYGDALSGVTDHTDGIYFEYLVSTSTNWQIKTAAGATRTATTTSVAVASGSWVKLAISATSSLVTFFINDVNVGTINTNIPTGTAQRCGPVVRSSRTSGATIATYPIYIDYYYFHFNFSANRY